MSAAIIHRKCKKNALAIGAEKIANPLLGHIMHITGVQFVSRKFQRKARGWRCFVHAAPQGQMLAEQRLFEANIWRKENGMRARLRVAARQARRAGVDQRAVPW